jgi:hypothetical protein
MSLDYVFAGRVRLRSRISPARKHTSPTMADHVRQKRLSKSNSYRIDARASIDFNARWPLSKSVVDPLRRGVHDIRPVGRERGKAPANLHRGSGFGENRDGVASSRPKGAPENMATESRTSTSEKVGWSSAGPHGPADHFSPRRSSSRLMTVRCVPDPHSAPTRLRLTGFGTAPPRRSGNPMLPSRSRRFRVSAPQRSRRQWLLRAQRDLVHGGPLRDNRRRRWTCT